MPTVEEQREEYNRLRHEQLRSACEKTYWDILVGRSGFSTTAEGRNVDDCDKNNAS